MDNRSWYVVFTKPNQEDCAGRNLTRQGFPVYFPRYAKTRRHARKIEMVARPLFPRYLFVALDITRDRWRSIQSTFGVVGLIMSREQPAQMPCAAVDAIRASEDSNGFVVLNTATSLRAGNRIRLLDGAFGDHCGVLDRDVDQHRVAVLLNILGRQVRVSVDVTKVTAA